ncbi:hypothetical protein [Noviluteimonas gilva]|uniref:hypothetical protein n=1 Tax=Noviluteimonas gilva TaxID=2682097 RepID=UPI0018D202BE|nr:hypothetical protein [Lysobacter gilvus]
MNAPNFVALSANAKHLLLDMCAQYRYGHNGDICVSRSLMKKRGWTSHSSLANAIDELMAAGFVELTRQGGLHQCSLYGFTWIKIDACAGKLDVRETKVPSGLWSRVARGEKIDLPARIAGKGGPRGRPSRPRSSPSCREPGPQAGLTGASLEEELASPVGTSETLPLHVPKTERSASSISVWRGRLLRRTGGRMGRGEGSKTRGTTTTGRLTAFRIKSNKYK